MFKERFYFQYLCMNQQIENHLSFLFQDLNFYMLPPSDVIYLSLPPPCFTSSGLHSFVIREAEETVNNNS
jgi:hypothetical protein